MRLGGRGRVLTVLLTCAVAVALLLARHLHRAATISLPLHRVAVIQLPGASSRFDYADLDPVSHQLFLAHMDSSELVQVDTISRRVVRVIHNLPTVTGVIAIPSLGRVFASTAGAGQVASIDEATGTVISRTTAGEFPDGLTYVPTTGQVWVSDESGGVETVLDARTGSKVATVQLGGEAGNVRYDPAGDRLLVDVQSHNELVAIDPRTRQVTSRVTVRGCEHDHGLILDATRAFVACDGNATLVVLGLRDFGRLAVHLVGDNPDVLALDSSRHLLYVAAESGVVTMLDTTATSARPGGRVIGRALLADNAHVVAVDRATGTVYFPLRSGPHGPELLLTAPQSPVISKGPS